MTVMITISPLRKSVSDSIGLEDSASISVTPLKINVSDSIGLTDSVSVSVV